MDLENDYQELLSFLYQCPIGIAELSASGNIRMLNALGSQLLMPIAVDNELSNLFDLLAPFDETFVAGIARSFSTVDTGALCTDHRVQLSGVAADQIKDRYLALTIIKLADDKLMAAFTDVTEAVAQEHRIREAIHEQALQRGRLETATGIIHDIGNAVIGVGTQTAKLLGNTHWIERRNLRRLEKLLADKQRQMDQLLGTGKGRALIDFIQALDSALAKRQQDLENTLQRLSTAVAHIQDIITIHRHYADDSKISLTPVNLKEVINDALSIQLGQLQKRKIHVHTEVVETGAMISGDRTRLVQVFVNLFKNSCEAFDRLAADERERTLTIQLDLTEDGMILVTLTDNACGFPPEQAKSLFEYGVGGKDKRSNSGLGLSSCLKVMQAHGGAIFISSDGVGRGARVTLQFPVIQ